MMRISGGAELKEYCRYRLSADGSGADVLRTYDGIDEALSHLRDFCRRNAPIDGVYGFSQGSNIGSLFVATALHRGSDPGLDQLRFAVHSCTALPGWTAQKPEAF